MTVLSSRKNLAAIDGWLLASIPFLCLDSLGLGFLGRVVLSLEERRQPEILSKKSLENWPGYLNFAE